MGQSTDGQICFGVMLDEDTTLPWDDDDEGNLEDWWLDTIHGYKPPFELFTDAGDYIGGKRPPQERLDAYYAPRREFDAAHPLPVKLVNTCSCDYPQWILAVPSSVQTAYRGSPKEFDPAALTVTEEDRAALLAFCREYRIGLDADDDVETVEFGAAWYLSSLWC